MISTTYLLACLLGLVARANAFTVAPSSRQFLVHKPALATQEKNHSLVRIKGTKLKAGGFAWEDPAEAFDQGVDNPFKNTDLMTDAEGNMKIDPARLLAPRLQGSNLYFIGMMGSGKSAIGDIVARRESSLQAFAVQIIESGQLFFFCLLLFLSMRYYYTARIEWCFL